jgi:hypothetical protein
LDKIIHGTPHGRNLQKSSPQETEHPEVPHYFLDETVPCVTQFVKGPPSEFVFNLNEVRISDWESSKVKSRIVPEPMCEQMIRRNANRNLKNISIMACISAAGEA